MAAVASLNQTDTTLNFNIVYSHPSGPGHPAPAQGNKTQINQATPTRDAYLRLKSQNTTVYHTETKPRSEDDGSRTHYSEINRASHVAECDCGAHCKCALNVHLGTQKC